MKTLTKIILVVSFLFSVLCSQLSVASAAIPHLINYQGRLTDSSGTPLNGSYQLTFRIYDAETAGNLLWEETHSGAVIQKGIFSLLLGSVTNLDLPFDKPYWLEIKVGDEVMSPRQRIASVGYAIRAENSDKIDGKYLDDLIKVGQVADGDLKGTYPNPRISDGTVDTLKLTDGAVSQAKLKTATGEVSHSGEDALIILPGGEYSFMCLQRQAGGGAGKINFMNHDRLNSDTSYRLFAQMYTTGGGAVYGRTRYITASGQDWWLFILWDKVNKEIISVSSSPDHPSYGNGGDSDKIPHPFGNYDQTKHEIILVDKETVAQLKRESEVTGKGVVELFNEEYKPDMTKEQIYKPLHSGKYLTQDGKQVMQMIKNLPAYIKVRKLIKLTAQERIERVSKKEQVQQKFEQEKSQKEASKDRAINKLKALGFTDDEIKSLDL